MSPCHYCNSSVKVRAVYHWNELLTNCQSCRKWAKTVRFLLPSNELLPFNAFANVYSSFWHFCILRLFRICLHCNCQLCQNSDALSIVGVKANKKSKVFTAVKVNRSKKSQYCRWQKFNKQNSFLSKIYSKILQ